MKDERLKNGGMQFITHYTERYSYLDAARMALEGGCRWVQLRMKDTPVETIEPVALEVQALCRQYGATFIIDDHVELAKKLHADGVHLGKKDMPIADARRILGAEYIIGGTANTFDNAKQFTRYLGLSPTYQQSGTSVNVKGHINRNGDSSLRSQLYVAAFSSLRCNSECKACFDRLRSNGKPGKVAVIAVANKLVRQAFAVVTHGKPYVDGFKSERL